MEPCLYNEAGHTLSLVVISVSRTTTLVKTVPATPTGPATRQSGMAGMAVGTIPRHSAETCRMKASISSLVAASVHQGLWGAASVDLLFAQLGTPSPPSVLATQPTHAAAKVGPQANDNELEAANGPYQKPTINEHACWDTIRYTIFMRFASHSP